MDRGVLEFVNTRGDSLNQMLQMSMKYGNYKFTTQIMRHFDISPHRCVSLREHTAHYFRHWSGTLFELAAHFGPVEGFEKIVSMGADIDIDDIACHSALFRAAESPNFDHSDLSG